MDLGELYKDARVARRANREATGLIVDVAKTFGAFRAVMGGHVANGAEDKEIARAYRQQGRVIREETRILDGQVDRELALRERNAVVQDGFEPVGRNGQLRQYARYVPPDQRPAIQPTGQGASVSSPAVQDANNDKLVVQKIINALTAAQLEGRKDAVEPLKEQLSEIAKKNGGILPVPAQMTSTEVVNNGKEVKEIKYSFGDTEKSYNAVMTLLNAQMKAQGVPELTPTAAAPAPTAAPAAPAPSPAPAAAPAPTFENRPIAMDLTPGKGTEAVAKVQVMLEQLGFATDKGGAKDGKVDGVVGDLTKDAVRKVEAILKEAGKLKGEVDGKIDPDFTKALEEAMKDPTLRQKLEVASGQRKAEAPAPAKAVDPVRKPVVDRDNDGQEPPAGGMLKTNLVVEPSVPQSDRTTVAMTGLGTNVGYSYPGNLSREQKDVLGALVVNMTTPNVPRTAVMAATKAAMDAGIDLSQLQVEKDGKPFKYEPRPQQPAVETQQPAVNALFAEASIAPSAQSPAAPAQAQPQRVNYSYAQNTHEAGFEPTPGTLPMNKPVAKGAGLTT